MKYINSLILFIMKRTFMTIAAALTAFMFVIASCDKPEPDSGNGGLIDDTTQNDDQNGPHSGINLRKLDSLYWFDIRGTMLA